MKIKIKTNYERLIGMIRMIERRINSFMDLEDLNMDAKIELDILLSIRAKFKEKAVAKETMQLNRAISNKFKIEMKLFEAYYLKKCIESPEFFNEVMEIETQIYGMKYFIDKL